MDVWIPLLSAFAGAIVGGAASVITIIVQTHSEDARQLRLQAVQLALAEHTHHVEAANKKGAGAVMPITMYYAYHFAALKKASKGQLNAASVAALGRQNVELRAAYEKAQPD